MPSICQIFFFTKSHNSKKNNGFIYFQPEKSQTNSHSYIYPQTRKSHNQLNNTNTYRDPKTYPNNSK